MNTLLTIDERNAVLRSMAKLVEQEKENILKANKIDLDNYSGDDLAMEDRLKVDDSKIKGMVASLEHLASQEDPVGVERFSFKHENGMQVYNKTASFGTVMIIYESRPDVTVEAAGIAFKSGNKILLKGGKESLNSNLRIVELWHQALKENNVSTEWVEYLQFDRKQTQEFLAHPTQPVDLIVPRGGERLIKFVKDNSSAQVIVSGRGNNFVYVHDQADIDIALNVILNGKTGKISACNAVDKVLIDSHLPNKEEFLKKLVERLSEYNVEFIADKTLEGKLENARPVKSEDEWYEEFLDYKILIGEVDSVSEAIAKINKYSGGHSASIISKDDQAAKQFMETVDNAAVYHNASTRFTDGGQLGLGGELAISTDKLHQRGPIGLQHLVTNKWYIHGNGQIR
ncbi:glutamate-5-semialdehyde dehydrogenase [Salinimicrobium catena]|uniref:Gamma-glutamyl phosphate reductase n=1 Tax=Salinimicrobium catena TaxID=390640 RepID=A0A1H5HNM7_9FLAO|nr:glutamate-5-semialdehyde dehydrogenase [Salinimicrobium catena]SDK71616.1 glutamate-5-semialdehyde dehydrogenase [Salinimicrobium catena]SEE29626.1 glutamate-5-semialdehyde dehydrogenase [Salinimicrobium catena]